jgi:hypothetical protein
MRFFGAEQLDEQGAARLRALAHPYGLFTKGCPRSWLSTAPKATRAVGTECELVTIKGGWHGMGRKEPGCSTGGEMIAWLKRVLR